MQTESLDALEDFISGLDPAKGFGSLVRARRIREERVDEFGHAVMNAAYQLTLGQEREPRLDLVQPGAGSRREMEMIPRVLRQPALDGRRLVRAVVVEDEMNLQIGRHLAIDRGEKLAELASSMARMTPGNHLAGGDVERRE